MENRPAKTRPWWPPATQEITAFWLIVGGLFIAWNCLDSTTWSQSFLSFERRMQVAVGLKWVGISMVVWGLIAACVALQQRRRFGGGVASVLMLGAAAAAGYYYMSPILSFVGLQGG